MTKINRRLCVLVWLFSLRMYGNCRANRDTYPAWCRVDDWQSKRRMLQSPSSRKNSETNIFICGCVHAWVHDGTSNNDWPPAGAVDGDVCKFCQSSPQLFEIFAEDVAPIACEGLHGVLTIPQSSGWRCRCRGQDDWAETGVDGQTSGGDLGQYNVESVVVLLVIELQCLFCSRTIWCWWWSVEPACRTRLTCYTGWWKWAGTQSRRGGQRVPEPDTRGAWFRDNGGVAR